MKKLWSEDGPTGAEFRAAQRSINSGLAGAVADAQRSYWPTQADPSPPLSDEVLLRRLVDDQFSDGVARQVRAGIARLPDDARARLLREARGGADIFDLLTVAQGGFSRAEMAEKERARGGRNWS